MIMNLSNANQTKRLAYQHQMGRYKKAMRQEFYLEAVFILYAMLEDRMRAFLFYCDLLNEERTHIKPFNESGLIYLKAAKIDLEKQTKIERLNDKRKVALYLLSHYGKNLSVNQREELNASPFLQTLRQKLNSIKDPVRLVNALNTLQPWAAERNALVHDLLGQDPGDFQDRLKVCAEQGYEIARVIDNAVKALHNKPYLREKDSIP